VDEWDSAIQSIRSRMECPAYEGLELPVQSGLVPIGRNPSSGLWEFLHLQSHDQDEAIPRYGDEAECSTTDKTGLIFVLLPGGEYNIGDVSSIDDQALNDDPEFAPAQDETHHLKITLKPFFISKYEMTQGQWLRALYLNHDENPSSHGVGLKVGENTVTLKHPVENVSWIDCCHAVRCIGCKLPSEAEWEYAARGNTRSIWWSGNEPACLEGVDNILDRTALPFAQRGQVRSWVQEGLDDHFASHAPVGLFAANPFGLHDVHGNVAEWCQDVYENRYNEIIRDGSANENGKTKDRVSRGGHWISPLCKTRTSARRSSDPNDTTSFIGLRPARSVQ
ncbi:MAG: formylglycine-generating enzyme family protein, partial [Planctomycetota bacterium]